MNKGASCAGNTSRESRGASWPVHAPSGNLKVDALAQFGATSLNRGPRQGHAAESRARAACLDAPCQRAGSEQKPNVSAIIPTSSHIDIDQPQTLGARTKCSRTGPATPLNGHTIRDGAGWLSEAFASSAERLPTPPCHPRPPDEATHVCSRTYHWLSRTLREHCRPVTSGFEVRANSAP